MPYNVIAEIDERIAGMVSGTEPIAGEVTLVSMWVAPFARGQSIGDALVNAVCEWARSRRANRVTLDVREGNDPAMRLYRRQRFVDAGPKPRSSEGEPPERRMTRFLNDAGEV